MKRKLCLPCMKKLKQAGKHDITYVGSGVNMKITCYHCKRRRYGAEYDVSRIAGEKK